MMKGSPSNNKNQLFSLLSKQGAAGSSLQSNLASKHAKLFQADGEKKPTTLAGTSKGYGLFSPGDANASSPIMEENSCSDNLSNLGQGPSPVKKPAQQPLAAMGAHFN